MSDIINKAALALYNTELPLMASERSIAPAEMKELHDKLVGLSLIEPEMEFSVIAASNDEGDYSQFSEENRNGDSERVDDIANIFLTAASSDEDLATTAPETLAAIMAIVESSGRAVKH